MRSPFVWAMMAGISVFGTFALNSAFAGLGQGPFPHPRPTSSFEGCRWVVETDDREVTARCPRGTFVVSGGCDTDTGSFRTGFPTDVEDDSDVTDGTGWQCRTTAMQPITAAALCCPF